jgi:ABC-2 type transport system ATP-binding protein
MVKLNDLDFGYRKHKPVLSSINLHVQPGIIYGLLGKNGEGKTTMLHLMSGLLFPDRGTCRVLGEEPARRRACFLQQIFLLPEEILLPDVTVSQYFRMYAPFYPTFRDDILAVCTESFEIDLSARLRKMSLGQKKKVAIALAFSVHTPLLLMDEPTNGLDIPSKSIFRKLMAAFMSEEQTVVISTHQVRDLESLIDAVIILDGNEIALDCPLEEIGGKLRFGQLEPDDAAALYSESSPAGTIGVTANRTGEKSIVSLELLFNAVIMSKADVKRIFNSNTLSL